MKNLNILLALLFLCSFSFAQTSTINPCGTKDGRSVWLKKYQSNPEIYDTKSDTVLYIPMTIHLVGNDQGSGYFPIDNLLEAFCTLNNDMAPSNIQFYMEGAIRYIANSAYNNHESVLDGAEMMFEYNVENTLNTYFVADPAGNCGYNLPYAGIAMRKSCSSPNDHTWAHEVGHAFTLPHPFLGWEGGVSHDNSINHNFADPAPTEVYYDYTYFLDTLIIDTMIIDTAIVELVDGSNCYEASDGFCDTNPDYIAARWNCNGNSVSSITQHDPTGASFVSDGTLIMSYADDACSNRFSDEQIAAMRANILDVKQALLYNQTPLDQVSSEPAVLIYPDDEVVQYDAVEFIWDSVANATHYILEVSRLATFPSALTEVVTTAENTVSLDNLVNEKTYYWRVKAFNNYSFCGQFSPQLSFETGEVSSANTIEGIEAVSIYPTLIKSGNAITIELNSTQSQLLKAELYNSTGQFIQRWSMNIQSGYNQNSFIINNVPSGIYMLHLNSAKGYISKKVIIQPY